MYNTLGKLLLPDLPPSADLVELRCIFEKFIPKWSYTETTWCRYSSILC